MIPGFDIMSTVNLAVRLGFFIAGGAGAVAIVKSVHEFRHGASGDSGWGHSNGRNHEEYGSDSARRWWGGKEGSENQRVGREAEVQAREKQLFQDVVAQEIQEKELSRIIKSLSEEMKSILTQTEIARKEGFRSKEQHNAYMFVWKTFYGLILSAENYLRVVQAKDLQLNQEFGALVQDVNTRAKKEGWGLKRDLKRMKNDLKKIYTCFDKMRTGIFAVHSILAKSSEFKLIMMDISALGTAGRFPVGTADKIPPRSSTLESYFQNLERNWLKKMIDGHQPSVHTAVEAYQEMVRLTGDFASELQRVRAELDLTTERKEMESSEAKAKEEAERKAAA